MVWYKFHLVLEFTLVFLLLLYVGNFYTSLKLWLKPPLELHVEVTAVAKDDSFSVWMELMSLEDQELIVFTDGVVAYTPLVSSDRIMLRYPGGVISEWKTFPELVIEPISSVVSPEEEGEYRTWLKVYRAQGDAIAF